MRILVVEDEPNTVQFLKKGLKEAGHNVDCATAGREGLFLATTEAYDAIVLDRMLPEVDGLTILRTLRASNNDVPVIILSALGELDDRVAGLRAGSDDYLIKPFGITELLARLDVLQRRIRRSDAGATVLTIADLEMDLVKRTVQRNGRKIVLQPKEFQLLEYLLRRADQIVTRTMLLEGVWDYHFDPKTNVIDVHISNLRSKVDKPEQVPLIHTVRGAGYRLGLPRD